MLILKITKFLSLGGYLHRILLTFFLIISSVPYYPAYSEKMASLNWDKIPSCRQEPCEVWFADNEKITRNNKEVSLVPTVNKKSFAKKYGKEKTDELKGKILEELFQELDSKKR
jgi:hypothetical protein